jgi:hypothetical protein
MFSGNESTKEAGIRKSRECKKEGGTKTLEVGRYGDYFW